MSQTEFSTQDPGGKIISTSAVEDAPKERPELPGKTPRFHAPNLADVLAERFKNPGEARVTLGMAKNPDDKWLTKHADAITAAQHVMNEHFEKLDLRPYLQEAATQQVGDDKINALRQRVRVASDAPVSEVLLAVLQGRWTRNTILHTPLHKPMEPWVHWAHLALLRKCPWVGYDQIAFTSLPKARNMLAKNFLASEAEWCFWLDGDTVAPFGYADAMYHRFGFNPGFVKPEYASINAVDRLQSRQKTLIGGMVPSKTPGNRLVIQPELNPRNQEDKDLVRALKKNGPMNKVYPVGYCGTGCLMVHRSVYLDIMRLRPDLAPKNPGDPFNFFGQNSGVEDMGEDIYFCKLAAECGHPAYLDLSILCAHHGPHSYVLEPEV